MSWILDREGRGASEAMEWASRSPAKQLKHQKQQISVYILKYSIYFLLFTCLTQIKEKKEKQLEPHSDPRLPRESTHEKCKCRGCRRKKKSAKLIKKKRLEHRTKN